jgi:hypothetical protein
MTPFTYTNRKGLTYYLNSSLTKTGKTRYYFAREPKQNLVEQVPDGYEVEESVNGIVSLVKARPRLILPAEVAAVESALKKHPKSRNYRVAVKHDQIIIYEAVGMGVDELSELFGKVMPLPADFTDRLQTEWSRHTQFSQVMRFILEDSEQRSFRAERWCYRGSIDDWIYAGQSGKIELLVNKLVPVLGTDAFYNLY